MRSVFQTWRRYDCNALCTGKTSPNLIFLAYFFTHRHYKQKNRNMMKEKGEWGREEKGQGGGRDQKVRGEREWEREREREKEKKDKTKKREREKICETWEREKGERVRKWGIEERGLRGRAASLLLRSAHVLDSEVWGCLCSQMNATFFFLQHIIICLVLQHAVKHWWIIIMKKLWMCLFKSGSSCFDTFLALSRSAPQWLVPRFF